MPLRGIDRASQVGLQNCKPGFVNVTAKLVGFLLETCASAVGSNNNKMCNRFGTISMCFVKFTR